MNRKSALEILSKLPDAKLEAIAIVVETTTIEIEDYSGMSNDGGSYWGDNATLTLNDLAQEIRNLKRK